MTILEKAECLMQAYRDGRLGGERMPEDANPGLAPDSAENYLYFTLPMALNYQRSAYALWESAERTYRDEQTRFLFSPRACLDHSFDEVQNAITKYGLALQRQKQTEIWIRLCDTLVRLADGDVRLLFDRCENSVARILQFLQQEHKKEFPYLSGNKISNYWLYVITRYTERRFSDPDVLNVAPDTHVCKASLQLGLINESEYSSANVQKVVSDAWRDVFRGTMHHCIDVHTPLWLWSRAGFPDIF